jgi:hypothetical protein
MAISKTICGIVAKKNSQQLDKFLSSVKLLCVWQSEKWKYVVSGI